MGELMQNDFSCIEITRPWRSHGQDMAKTHPMSPELRETNGSHRKGLWLLKHLDLDRWLELEPIASLIIRSSGLYPAGNQREQNGLFGTLEPITYPRMHLHSIVFQDRMIEPFRHEIGSLIEGVGFPGLTEKDTCTLVIRHPAIGDSKLYQRRHIVRI